MGLSTRNVDARARVPFWRNRKVRSFFYQAVFLAGTVFVLFEIYKNVTRNLKSRGIATGFDFLSTPSNFTISETLPIPLFRDGMVYFTVALLGGAFGVWILSKIAARYQKTLGQDNRLATAAILLLLVIPGGVLYLFGNTIQTVTFGVPSTYGIGLLTGLMNTLKISVLAIVFGTIAGTFVGVARLSSNWLIRNLAMGYIEILRNIPLLVQLFFWYFGVLRLLPSLRQSFCLSDFLIINNRGISLVKFIPTDSFKIFVASIFVAGIAVYYYMRFVKRRQEKTGAQLPVLYPSLGLFVVLPGIAILAQGLPFSVEYPRLVGFNYRDGATLTPEFVSLLMALVMYCSAFVAEIVRSGIQAIPKGQTEAGHAIGLKRGKIFRLIILPQARRIIVPPITATYLSTIKDSSLGVAIGFPDLVSVGTTILDVSGRVIELIGLIMLFYMVISLLVSLGMNWYNAKIQLKSR